VGAKTRTIQFIVISYRVFNGRELLDELNGQIGLCHPGIVRRERVPRCAEGTHPHPLAEIYLAVEGIPIYEEEE
jgi:hypothetical protein